MKLICLIGLSFTPALGRVSRCQRLQRERESRSIRLKKKSLEARRREPAGYYDADEQT
jgi:hypothetical protein